MSSTASKLTKSSSSSRMTPAPITRNLSARSVPRTTQSSSSATATQSKEGGFKRPKDLAANRSNDVQRSVRMAKYLQTRLRCLKIEEELKKRQEYYSEKFTDIWNKNNDLSEKIFAKKLALEKLKIFKETFDKLSQESKFVEEVNNKLNAMDNDLQFLVEHIEGQTSQTILQGVDNQYLDKLNDVFHSLSHLEQASKIVSLAREVSRLRSLIEDHEKIQIDVDRLKAELNGSKQEFASLKAVEQSIGTS